MYPNILKLSIDKKEKRRFERLHKDFSAIIKTEYLGEKKVVIKNISEGGIYIEVSFHKLDLPKISFTCLKYEKIFINIEDIPDGLKCIGLARWGKEIYTSLTELENKYGLGIEFTEILPEQKNRIISYIFSYKSSGRIAKPKEKQLSERRVHTRVVATFPIEIEINDKDYSSTGITDITGYTLNISKGGAAIAIKKPIPSVNHITLKIKLYHSPKLLELIAEIAWYKNQSDREYYQYGIKFLELSSGVIHILEQIIKSKINPEPKNISKFKIITPTIISEPVVYKNKSGATIIGMFDHFPIVDFERPFIIVPPAHGETKKDSIMLSYYLVQNNFNVIRYDNTCHLGESDGDIYLTTLDKTKEDLTATLDYIQHQFSATQIGITVASLTSRVAIRVASEDLRINFLLILVGVVNIQYTLKAVYQEDIIGMILLNKIQSRNSFNILGYESDIEYPLSSIRNNLHTLKSTMEDLRKISIPVVAIAAERDAWVDINEVKEIFQQPSKFPRVLLTIPNAMHHFYENLNIAKQVLQYIVFYSLKYLDKTEKSFDEIESPDFRLVTYQNAIEKERLKRYELTKEEEKEFWNKYLNKYVIVEKSPDFKDYLRLLASFIPWSEPNWRILDAGCGPGHFNLWLVRELIKNNGNASYTYIGVDFVETALQKAKLDFNSFRNTIMKNTAITPLANHSYVLSDLDINPPYNIDFGTNNCSLCFKDNIFDIIYCSLLISYLKNPLITLKELFKILKPGKSIVVSSLKPHADLSLAFKNMITWMSSDEEIEEARLLLNSIGLIKQKESEGHYQFYSEDELADIISEAGGQNLKIFKSLFDQINIIISQK